MNEYICGRCGQSQGESAFYQKRGRPDTTWCKQCYKDWHVRRSGGRIERSCDECGAIVRVTAGTKRATGAVFCSRPCKELHGRKRQKRARLDAKEVRPCIACGEPMPLASRVDRVYCSPDCRRRIDLHAKVRKRIREELSALGEECGICGQPVDSAISAPDPLSPSLDHRRPLASFGGHEAENLQLAHLGCNARKGASDQ